MYYTFFIIVLLKLWVSFLKGAITTRTDNLSLICSSRLFQQMQFKNRLPEETGFY